MKLLFIKYAFLCFLLSNVTILAQENKEENKEMDKEMKQALENIVEGPIPGISVAIANSDGLIWSGTAGYSHLEERGGVSQTHLFGIGNISNPYVGMVILQLAEKGMIDLNATPQSILGDVVADIANADDATLLQLLNHTSGIYSWDNDEDWARRGRGVQMNPKYRWGKDEPLKYITRERHSATGEPGEKYSYSKSNYTILGLIAEKTTGNFLEDEVRTRISEPLGLKDTYYDTYEVVPYNSLIGSYHLATNQFIAKVGINAKFEFGLDRLIDTSGASLSTEGLASGMVSTPRDVALFATALRSGNLVSEQSLKHIKPRSKNGLTGIHSDILGFTVDMHWLDDRDLVIVSFINMGAADTGENATMDYLNTYLEKIILPIAKKYVN